MGDQLSAIGIIKLRLIFNCMLFSNLTYKPLNITIHLLMVENKIKRNAQLHILLLLWSEISADNRSPHILLHFVHQISNIIGHFLLLLHFVHQIIYKHPVLSIFWNFNCTKYNRSYFHSFFHYFNCTKCNQNKLRALTVLLPLLIRMQHLELVIPHASPTFFGLKKAFFT